MKRFQLDLKNLPKHSPAQARRLDTAPIDYSDIGRSGTSSLPRPPRSRRHGLR